MSRYIIQVYYLFLSNSCTSCPIPLADTSNTTLNSSVDNGLFLHMPDFSRKASSASLLSCVKEIASDYYFLIYLIFLPCQEGVLNLLIFFSVSFKMLIKIFSSDQFMWEGEATPFLICTKAPWCFCFTGHSSAWNALPPDVCMAYSYLLPSLVCLRSLFSEAYPNYPIY